MATSHTAAFCKAVEQGCKSAGGLTVDMKADDGLCKLITEGWTMFVISEMIEKSIPSLPAWLQMAMNSVNMGFKQVNEIEAASLMAELMKHGKSLNDALAQVEKSDPLCKPQLQAIAYYVSRYGGGEQQGLVLFLNDFSALALNKYDQVLVAACAILHSFDQALVAVCVCMFACFCFTSLNGLQAFNSFLVICFGTQFYCPCIFR